ncbi:hypothetical protein AB4Z45_27825 [Paenibacillus sp. MCAF9]|uniref:hypothetical protein n=1 Tax=Paenibacillus sp. MCAF9 TaxID=3233046 RepID=UPI003F9C4EC0
MKKPLNYDVKIIMASRQIGEAFKKSHPDAVVIKDFFDYHNDTCPRCQESFKVSNNTVQKVGSISGFVVPENKRAYIYALCRNCSSNITKDSRFGSKVVHGSPAAENTEKFILNALLQR